MLSLFFPLKGRESDKIFLFGTIPFCNKKNQLSYKQGGNKFVFPKRESSPSSLWRELRCNCKARHSDLRLCDTYTIFFLCKGKGVFCALGSGFLNLISTTEPLLRRLVKSRYRLCMFVYMMPSALCFQMLLHYTFRAMSSFRPLVVNLCTHIKVLELSSQRILSSSV